jgi:hypothetical protein
MLTNVIHAKVSTHSVTMAVCGFAFAAHHFFSDPQAAAWLCAHWVMKDLYETVGTTLIAFGIYKQPTPPADPPTT